MNRSNSINESKTYIDEVDAHSNGFYLDNDDSATVVWYKWFICYLNKSHVFANYFDKQGIHKLKCVRCGVEKKVIG